MGDSDSQIVIPGGTEEDYYDETSRDKEPVYVPGCYEEEDEEETVEAKQSCLFLRGVLSVLFPDRQVFVWFATHIAIILIYALFNLNAYTISVDSKLDIEDYTTNTIWSMLLVFCTNLIMFMVAMIIRYILVKGIFQYMCSRNAYLFALLSMLDPHIFSLVWASIQSILWQIAISRPASNPKLFCVDIPMCPGLTAKYMTFNDESLLWISCTIYIHIILSLRCLALSIISFIFELNLLVNSNEALKKYLKLYTNIRKLNIDWLTFVMSNPELVRKLKRVFATPRLRCKLFPDFDNECNKNVDFKSKHGLQVLNEFHHTNYVQYFSAIEGISTPSDVTDVLVEQSSTSSFSNWLLIYYVIRVPPVVSLLHQELMLKDDSVVFEAAALLFEHMYVTLTKLKQKDVCQTLLSEGSRGCSNFSFTHEASLNSDNITQSNEIGSLEFQEGEGQTSISYSNNNNNNNDIRPSLFYLPTEESSIDKPLQDPSPSVNYGRYSIGGGRSRLRNQRAISLMNLNNFRKTIVDKESITDDSSTSTNKIITPDYQFNQNKGDDARFLSADQLKPFLLQEEGETIMGLLDLSGHGRINLSMLQQAFLNLYSTRKKFKNNVKGQDSIFKVLSRLLSTASWLVSIVTMAFLAGITAEAIVVSGAALLSAITVALSYLYTNFLTSVIFVAFSNPYSVGDRVRLNDGEPLTVKKIRTYTTEFVTLLGKVMVYQNAMLATMKITNESRATRASIQVDFKVDANTSEELLNRLTEHITTTCNARPNDFVKDSVMMYLNEFNPGYCYSLSIWVTCIEGWANWQRIFHLKGEIMEVIMRQCKKMGISYSLPVQPLSFPKQLSIRNVRKTDLPPLGKRP